MNKHIREHQTQRSLRGWHFDQMRKAGEATTHQSPLTNHNSHPCAVEGCNRSIRLEYLMCGKHWHMVSVSTQRAVYATWRAYSANGRTPHDGNRYRQARAQAIAEATAVAATEPQRGSSNVAEGNALGPNPARDPRPERASQ